MTDHADPVADPLGRLKAMARGNVSFADPPPEALRPMIGPERAGPDGLDPAAAVNAAWAMLSETVEAVLKGPDPQSRAARVVDAITDGRFQARAGNRHET